MRPYTRRERRLVLIFTLITAISLIVTLIR